VKSKQAGADPEDTVQLPDPKLIKSTSTMYDNQGQVTAQWVREEPDAVKRANLWEEYKEALMQELPKVEPVKLRKRSTKEQLAVYPVSDQHIGMYAWHEEAGEDWDLNIAETSYKKAIDHLMAINKECRSALIVFLGDFMHYDNFESITPKHKNLLDADTRFPKMLRVAIRAMRYTIERALSVHQQVRVIVEIGNHDVSSSIFLQEAMSNIYEREKRVSIDTSPSHYHYYLYGKNLIGSNHGCNRVAKIPDLPGIMATDRPKEWGETKHRVWLTGHIHRDKVSEFRGCKVETFRAWSPNDAWAQHVGYRSKRDMKAMVFDKEHGEVARYTVSPEVL
jgi:hypothetical protein